MSQGEISRTPDPAAEPRGSSAWIWWLAPLVLAGLVASVAVHEAASGPAGTPRAEGDFWSVRDAGGGVLELASAEQGLTLMPGQILRLEDPDPARRLTGATFRIEGGGRQSGYSDIRFHGADDSEFRVYLVPARPLTAFIAVRRGDAPWTRLQTGKLADQPADPRAPADIALTIVPGSVSVAWNGTPLVTAEDESVRPPQRLSLWIDCARVLGCDATGAAADAGGASPQSWHEGFSGGASGRESDRSREWLLLTGAVLVLAVLYLRSRCDGRPSAGLLARATLLFLAPMSVPLLVGWVRLPPLPLLVGSLVLLGMSGLAAACKLLREASPAPVALRDHLRTAVVVLGVGAGLALAAGGAAGAVAKRESDLQADLASKLARESFALDAPRKLDLSNMLDVPGLRRDLELRARLTLAPDSLLEIRLRISEGRRESAMALCLSTVPDFGTSFCHESAADFSPVGSGSAALPAGQPLELAVHVRRDRYSAEVNGRTIAEVTDREFGSGGLALLAAAGSAQLQELTVEAGAAAAAAPSPARAQLVGAGLALALLLGLGLLAVGLLRQSLSAALQGAAFCLVPIALGLATSEGGQLTGLDFALTAGASALLLAVHGAWRRPAPGAVRIACFTLIAATAATALLGSTAEVVRAAPAPERAWSKVFPRPRFVPGLVAFEHETIRHFNGWLQNHRFRERTFPVARTPGSVRILAVGSSSTWGHGIPEESGLDYPTVTGQLLKLRFPQLPIEVINGGVPGSTTARMLRIFREVLLRFSPDIVTLSFYYNDSYLPPTFDEDGELARLVAPGYVPDAADAQAEERRTLQGSHAQEQLVKALSEHGPPTLPLWRTICGDPSGPAPPDYFAGHLRAYAQLCKDAGIRLVLIKEPTRGDGPRLWKDEFYASIDAVAAEFGLPVVDPRPLLAAAAKNDPVFMDDIHPTEAGHALVARALTKALAPIVEQVAKKR